MPKEIMTIKEFAEAMDLKIFVVRRLVKENRLVCFNSGTHTYINYELSKEKLWKEPSSQNIKPKKRNEMSRWHTLHVNV